MAKVSIRKGPSREKRQLKERQKIEMKIFDRQTLKIISKFMSSRIISSLDFPIKSGKESVVFRATAGEGYPAKYLAVKVYKIEAGTFTHMRNYIENDPRFEARGSKRRIIYDWVRKEYRNLLLCENMGIRVPHPHAFSGNVLVMDFIGSGDGVPAKTLKETGSGDPQADYDFIMDGIEKMYKNGFVHADLSEYNILRAPSGELYIMDIGQGVLAQHPHFEAWRRRDISNINKYFRRFGVDLR